MLKLYESEIVKVLNIFTQTQEENLRAAARMVVDRMAQGGKFYAIGTGHSHMVGEEFYGRAGGLACIQMVAPMELTLGEHPLKSTKIERIADYAHVIMMQYKLQPQDIVLISSNSGRNAMIVELALKLREQGTAIIGFTGMAHTSQVTSRHPCGKRLFELCDLVIDNCGCPGDARIDLEGVRGKMGASSSIVGMYMAQCLSMLIAQELAARNMEVPVFISSNLDGGDSWNKSIMEKYYGI